MKRCPTCNRSYSDSTVAFCADDGTRLVDDAPLAQTIAPQAPPSPQPAVNQQPYYAPAAPAPTAYTPRPKRKKALAIIALLLGLLALPVMMYLLSQEFLWAYAFRNVPVPRLFLGRWGIAFGFGVFLTFFSFLAGVVALFQSIRQPARYGGRVMAITGPFLSLLLAALVIGGFAFRRFQGPTYSSTYYNYASPTPSPSSSPSYSTSADMTEDEKYRLFYAATKTNDNSLQQRAARKIGIIDSNGRPTSSYKSFLAGSISWAFKDTDFISSIDTPEKARAYVLAHL